MWLQEPCIKFCIFYTILNSTNTMTEKNADIIQPLKEVANLLGKIDRTYASERKNAIALLQQKIWDDPTLQGDDLYFLQDLTGDLNFYEPIERDHDGELGYYDDNRLSALIAEAIKTIESILNQP